ncbi:hypothetical protein PoB_005604700 [Plakobranchus ocellatus]|uniref:Uncharacterized protein n=1 Tax=Plakobranchus ocellatus TaxID=259542 RepID=A0AAV4CDY3_9GAST|nr:hypothetical protein PoB_005604700 [Plakobranchus ocellatus]
MWQRLWRTSRLNLTTGQRPSLSYQGYTSLPRRRTNRYIHHSSLARSITRHETHRTCLGHSRTSHPKDEFCSLGQRSINSKPKKHMERHPTKSNFQHPQLYEVPKARN